MKYIKLLFTTIIFFSVQIEIINAQNSSIINPKENEANSEATEEELELFASAYEEIQEIDKKAQKKMAAAIELKGLSVHEYYEIKKALALDKNADISETQLAEFRVANHRVDEIEKEAEKEIRKTIRRTGLSIKRYKEIEVNFKKQ